jgi:hypothetical protein
MKTMKSKTIKRNKMKSIIKKLIATLASFALFATVGLGVSVPNAGAEYVAPTLKHPAMYWDLGLRETYYAGSRLKITIDLEDFSQDTPNRFYTRAAYKITEMGVTFGCKQNVKDWVLPRIWQDTLFLH